MTPFSPCYRNAEAATSCTSSLHEVAHKMQILHNLTIKCADDMVLPDNRQLLIATKVFGGIGLDVDVRREGEMVG